MRIKKVLISVNVQEKIFKKHSIKRREIEDVFYDEPYFFKTRGNKYMAIGFVEKYITVVFDYKENNAEIITAYLSSKWQKKLYRAKK